MLDLVLDRVAADGAMARSAPNWFYRDGSSDVVDPREKQLGPEALPARFAEREHELTAWWTDRVVRLAQAGADGFRLLGLEHVPPRFLKSLIGVVRQETKACLFLGWTPGVPWPHLPAFEEAGLDAVFASTAWWDGRAAWYVEEQNLLRRIGRVIGVAEAPFEERLAESSRRPIRARFRRPTAARCASPPPPARACSCRWGSSSAHAAGWTRGARAVRTSPRSAKARGLISPRTSWR